MTLEGFLGQFGGGLSHGGPAALWVAFLAGIMASAVCPCTLPVGLSAAGMAGVSETRSRWDGLRVAASFFLGIVLNLTLLGTLAGRLGGLVTESFGRYWALSMAILSLAAAVVAFRAPRLSIDQLTAWRRPGLAGAFGYGFVFSLGTSVAPLLLLLTVAASQGRSGTGLLLAFTFGLGRGLPFLLAGVAGSVLTGFIGLAAWRRPIGMASGVLLLFVSAYYARTFVALL